MHPGNGQSHETALHKLLRKHSGRWLALEYRLPGGATHELISGAIEFLERLCEEKVCDVAIATGCFDITARFKLECCGIALERFPHATFDLSSVVYFGEAPWDVPGGAMWGFRTIAFVFLVVTITGQTSAQQRTSDTSVAVRLQRLEDMEEIRTLLLDYGRFLDSRDLVAYSRLFAKDGEWVGGFGSARGPEGILAFMQKNLGTGPNRGNTFHILSNFEIVVDRDTATAWSRWTFVTPGADGKPVISQAGRYDDVLVREDGRWRFKRRTASNDTPPPK